MRLYFIIFITAFLVLSAKAQKGSREQKQAMSKLQWMTGNWTGRSIANIDRQKRITAIHESVQTALDGTLLLISVRASDKDSNTNRQSLAYTSFSVVSYDIKNKTYRWRSWRTNGNDYEDEPFTADDHSFQYTSHQNGGMVRYTGSAGSKGEFLETGESSEDGNNWQQFITMKLTKTRQ